MAVRRSSSWGPEPNPFWSERVVQEMRVRNARPVDLPVPSEKKRKSWRKRSKESNQCKREVRTLVVPPRARVDLQDESGSAHLQVGKVKNRSSLEVWVYRQKEKCQLKVKLEHRQGCQSLRMKVCKEPLRRKLWRSCIKRT